MIHQDFLHLGLFLLIVLHAFCDAAMDANAHLRIHLALHPLRDSWHIFKHVSRGALIGIGLIWAPCVWWDGWATAITAVCGVVVGRFVWDATYKNPWRWLRLDETIRIKTGIKWLDKWLGIHH